MKTKLSFKHFDAELNTDVCDPFNNAELTLTLKIGFRRINPSGGAANGTYHDYGDATKPTRKIIKWSDASWQNWKANFVQSAQKFWHGKFWLINDCGSFAFSKAGETYYPNVWCRFKLVSAEAGVAGVHHTIDVVRLHSSENWFGSHSTLYDSKDTNSVHKKTDSAGKAIMQRAHVHEVGHLLGLNHVDVGKPHCPAASDTNASACYGIADVDMNSVMGGGMQLREEHAYPWREALRNFARDEFNKNLFNLGSLFDLTKLLSPIATVTSVWPAKTKRHYPRTATELKNGTMVTTRPARKAA